MVARIKSSGRRVRQSGSMMFGGCEVYSQFACKRSLLVSSSFSPYSVQQHGLFIHGYKVFSFIKD